MNQPMGPRRRQWEKLRQAHDRLVMRVVQFNVDLAAIKQNNSGCADLAVEPHLLPESLPPMPELTD